MFWTAHHTGKNQKLREEISISNPGPIVDDIETFEIKTPLDDGGFDFFKSDKNIANYFLFLPCSELFGLFYSEQFPVYLT